MITLKYEILCTGLQLDNSVLKWLWEHLQPSSGKLLHGIKSMHDRATCNCQPGLCIVTFDECA